MIGSTQEHPSAPACAQPTTKLIAIKKLNLTLNVFTASTPLYLFPQIGVLHGLTPPKPE